MKNLLFIIFISSFLITNSLFANLEKVSLQLEWKHQFEFAGFYAAIEKGYYKDLGLDVEIKEFRNGINITNDVINKKSTFGISSSSLVLEKLRNKPVVLISSFFKQNALALITKPNIKNLADLKNKKIMALSSEIKNTSLGVMLQNNGLTSFDYTLIEHDYKIDKFVNNKIDAMTIFITSQTYELDKLDIKYNTFNPASFGLYSYDLELFTSKEEIENSPLKVENFVRASIKGWKYALKNKDEIINLIYNKYSKRKTKEALLYEANQTEKLFKTDIFKIGSIAPELIKLNAEMFIKLGLLDRNIKIPKALSNYYYDFNNKIKTILTNEEKEYIDKNKIIKVYNEDNIPPFNFNIEGKALGYSLDYLKLITSKVGFDLKYVNGFNEDEYINKLKNNEIDILLNITKTTEREKYINFSTPYLKSIDAVFTKKTSNSLKKLSDFNGKKLAVIKKSNENNILRKKNKNIELVLVKDTLDGLKKVIFGEADGFIGSLIISNYFIANNLISTLKPAFEIDDSYFDSDLFIATNKENKTLSNILKKARKLVTEKELQEVKSKWINKDVLPNIHLERDEKKYLKNKKLIKVCINSNWEPFEFIDEQNNSVGISRELIKLAFNKLGVKTKIIVTKSLENSISLLKANKCDIINSLNLNKQNQNNLIFTKSFITDENVIISDNNLLKISDLKKIKNKTISVPNNKSIYKLIKSNFPNLKVIIVPNDTESFRLIKENKADFIVSSLINAIYKIKKENLHNLKILTLDNTQQNELKVALSKKNILLRNIIDKSIQTISKREKEQIMNRYISVQIPQKESYLLEFFYFSFFIFILMLVIILWNYQLRKRISIEVEKNYLQQDIMFKQNKKAELGNLIANISHQWRDSLTKIGYINLNLRVRLLHEKEITIELLNKSTLQIEQSLDFMSDTMQNFLDYYKPSIIISEFVVLESIQSALNIIDTKVKDNNMDIKFIGDMSKVIKGIKNEWMQVWINLIINSINISIKRNIKDPLIKVIIQKDSIIFEDNCGKIDLELLAQINKNNYKGIGIKMAKEIALKNGQNMLIKNSKYGAIFRFSLKK